MHCQHIKIIEDNQALREAIAITLRLNNYKVTESRHLGHVFDDSQLPDMYIIDYWLEDMEGMTLCSIIKSNEETKDIPVIIMSGDISIETKVYNAGADAFLRKPFSMREMLNLINNLFQPGAISISHRV